MGKDEYKLEKKRLKAQVKMEKARQGAKDERAPSSNEPVIVEPLEDNAKRDRLAIIRTVAGLGSLIIALLVFLYTFVL